MDTATALIDPECQFVGCLLWLPCRTARRVLAGMSPADFADAAAGHVLLLAIEVIADGRDPSPVNVYAHAVATGRVGGEHARHRLTRWLADAYTATSGAAPAHYAADLKGVVLEAAWRRAITEHARRLLQAADTAPTDVLADLTDDTGPIDALKTRVDTVTAGPGTPTTRQEAA